MFRLFRKLRTEQYNKLNLHTRQSIRDHNQISTRLHLRHQLSPIISIISPKLVTCRHRLTRMTKKAQSHPFLHATARNRCPTHQSRQFRLHKPFRNQHNHNQWH
jgi:hypothetical protein